MAALLEDLKQRGLMNDTLVIWGGEFGRMPISQIIGDPKDAGRDHNPRAFSIWMAGAGVKPGLTYGATDEFGFAATENPVIIYLTYRINWHATGCDRPGLTGPA